MLPNEIQGLIESALPGSQVMVSGDGRHFEAVVVSDEFVGKSVVQRHRMVYAALGDRFQTDAVHALSLKTHTPDEWRDLQR